jgi:hypothetical protein
MKIPCTYELFISNLIGSNMFSSWELFALILHSDRPENYFTLFWYFIWLISGKTLY